jgi:glycosyltransferase involved in cell wall biosynthesis
MSLSVVIPNFNHGKLLARAVQALMAQRPLPAEIIVVNDGSTDNSRSVIAALQACFPCILAIDHKVNRGVAASMNEGLHTATGEFVYFAAADDFCLSGLFASANSALIDHREAAFYCSRVVLVDPAGAILGFRPFMQPSPRAAFLNPKRVRQELARSDQWCVGPAVIYRRNRLLEIGGFDPAMGAFTDGIIVRRLALESGFFFDPQLLVCWEISPTSFSARTALSLSENSQLIAKARDEVRSSFPADIRIGYAESLSRRLRFNMARLWLVFGKGKLDLAGLAEVLQFTGYSRSILQLAARLPFARYLLLAWMAIVLRPYSIGAVVAGCYRALKARLFEKPRAQRAIARVRSLAANYQGDPHPCVRDGGRTGSRSRADQSSHV